MTVMTWLYFVKDAGKVDFVAQNEGIILETLQKYADSCVKRVSAYAAKLRTNAE
jgi:chemotaxis response regulator CheB